MMILSVQYLQWWLWICALCLMMVMNMCNISNDDCEHSIDGNSTDVCFILELNYKQRSFPPSKFAMSQTSQPPLHFRTIHDPLWNLSTAVINIICVWPRYSISRQIELTLIPRNTAAIEISRCVLLAILRMDPWYKHRSPKYSERNLH